jgi:hypothetical protein
MKNLVFLILLFFASNILLAQENIDFFVEDFKVDVFDEQILVRYTIKPGAVCNDFIIERSDKGGEFKEVFRHFGVCGFTDRSASYHFTDFPEQSGILAYRIVIYGNFLSDPIQVNFLKVVENQTIAYPNPALEHLNILFKNKKGEKFNYLIFNQAQQLMERGETLEKEIRLNTSTYKSGKYFYIIQNNYYKFEGQFLKIN